MARRGKRLARDIRFPNGSIPWSAKFYGSPDINLHPKDMLRTNGHYRIPSTGSDPNPFIKVAGARGEIYAYVVRNAHRMTWDVPSETLIVNDTACTTGKK